MAFEPNPDELHWQSPTRPRKPGDLFPPAAPPPKPSPWRFVTPVAIVLGLGVLGMVVSLFAVLLVRAQMMQVTVIQAGDARQTYTRAATIGDLMTQLDIQLGPYDVTYPAVHMPVTRDLVVRIEKARPVTLTVDGETSVYWTPLTNPGDILDSAGLDVEGIDRILVDGTRTDADALHVWPVPAAHITLRHAIELTIDDGGSQTMVQTTGDTVGDALFEAGISLYLADAVTPDLPTPVQPGMAIEIERSQPVSIVADGKTIETRTHGSRVMDALADGGIALVGLDYAIPSEDAAIQPGMSVRVIRVREETVIEEEELPFEVVYQADAELEIDQRAVVQAGRPGVQAHHIRVRYENGIEVERSQDEIVVAQPPQNRVIAYGTNVVLRTIDTPEGPREYWRVLRVYATSYHPAALGGDNITATGRVLQKGVIGVYRNVIPFDTQLYVPGYGVGVAGDTGPHRGNDMWIDLGYSDHDYEPWHRYTDVYLLTPVPADIDYILP